jgi:hypothetical protein
MFTASRVLFPVFVPLSCFDTKTIHLCYGEADIKQGKSNAGRQK